MSPEPIVIWVGALLSISVIDSMRPRIRTRLLPPDAVLCESRLASSCAATKSRPRAIVSTRSAVTSLSTRKLMAVVAIPATNTTAKKAPANQAICLMLSGSDQIARSPSTFADRNYSGINITLFGLVPMFIRSTTSQELVSTTATVGSLLTIG